MSCYGNGQYVITHMTQAQIKIFFSCYRDRIDSKRNMNIATQFDQQDAYIARSAI